MLRDEQDAVGHELLDFHTTGSGFEIIEREDGFFDVTGGPEIYFREYEEWSPHEKRAMEYVRGRVVDIGCGAGRHGLYLQAEGFRVLGIDNSPLAVQVCMERGLGDAQVMSITQLSSRLGTFDTLLLMGNNFGLFSHRRRARWLLRRFWKMTSEKARLLAESYDPRGSTVASEHQAYQGWNQRRGRMPGQARIRVRYKRYVTSLFDYLMVSPMEMTDVLEGTDWAIRDILRSDTPAYIAIIEKRRT